MNLKLSECVATRNNAAYLEEPFDHLLACIHQLLLLQPQERCAQQASDTGETCEFAFSEDQLVCNFACISVILTLCTHFLLKKILFCIP